VILQEGVMMKKICVIGALNMDLVAVADRFPRPGETITGKMFGTYPGGKGANQAVAAGRLGADVRMAGKVGDDLYGRQYLDILSDNNVIHTMVTVENGISSGIAMIEVDGSGENHIIYIPGANAKVDPDYIDKCVDYISECDIFMLQLELPLDTIMYAAEKLKTMNKTIILDPAPGRPLPDTLLRNLSFMTPNETELQLISGCSIIDKDDIKKAALTMIDRGVDNVIAKAGKNGAYIINRHSFVHVPGFKVKAIDTTAAGDSFNAGLAYGLSTGMGIEDCVRLANATGAISTTAMGAQMAMPSLREVELLLKNRNQG
jgi:ribokinase